MRVGVLFRGRQICSSTDADLISTDGVTEVRMTENVQTWFRLSGEAGEGQQRVNVQRNIPGVGLNLNLIT